MIRMNRMKTMSPPGRNKDRCCHCGHYSSLHRSFALLLLSVLIIAVPGCSPKDSPPFFSPTPVAPAPQKTLQSADVRKGLEEAEKLKMMGNLPGARRLLEEIIDRGSPTDPLLMEARRQVAPIYHQMGEYEPAIREYRIILDSNPANPLPLKAELARAYMAGDRPREVPPLIEPGMDPYCRWGTCFSLLARSRYATYLVTGDEEYLQEMKSDLEEGLKSSSSPVAKHMLSASLSLMQSDFSSTASHLKKCLEADPSLRDQVSNLFLAGAISVALGRRDEGAGSFEEVLTRLKESDKIDPKNLMDGFFAMLALKVLSGRPLEIRDVREVQGRDFPPLKDPEMLSFVETFQDYATAGDTAGDDDALDCLMEMSRIIEDESIEGDYFFDVIYRPFNQAMIFTLAGEILDRKQKTDSGEEYRQKAGRLLQLRFPPESRR